MTRPRWLFFCPLLLLAGVGGFQVLKPHPHRTADGRLATPAFLALEQQLGRRLRAPTWLPRGGRVGSAQPTLGARRVLQDYCTDRGENLAIISQEPRSAERDKYHDHLFQRKAEATVEFGSGRLGYVLHGPSGERRLFWREKDSSVVISSPVLSYKELIEIATRMR